VTGGKALRSSISGEKERRKLFPFLARKDFSEDIKRKEGGFLERGREKRKKGEGRCLFISFCAKRRGGFPFLKLSEKKK